MSGWYTELSPIAWHKLKPGERITLAQRKLMFEDQPDARVGFGEGRAVGGAGEYRVRYDSIQGTGSGKGEWAERLVTGETRLTVAAQAPAAAPVAPSEIPGTKPQTKTIGEIPTQPKQ